MVLEHVSNGTYPLHVRDDPPGRSGTAFAPSFLHQQSLRKTDGQTPFGVYGTADTNALKSPLDWGSAKEMTLKDLERGWVSSKDWRTNHTSKLPRHSATTPTLLQ